MRDHTLRILIRATAWVLWLLAIGFAARLCAQQGWSAAGADWGGRLLLSATAWACLRTTRPGVIDLSSAALIAMLVIWPDAWTLALGLAVLGTAGIGSRAARSISTISAAAVGWSVCYALITLLPQPEALSRPLLLALQAVVAWTVYELLLSFLSVPLQALEEAPSRVHSQAILLNPAIAWALACAAWFAQSSVALAAAPLTLAAQLLLVRLHRVRNELRNARRDLDLRTAELSTLHAVGRELLARPGPERVGPLLDRECRKLFDPIAFGLLLSENGTLGSVYRREGERIDTARVAPGADLMRWLHDEKRGLRWKRDDAGPDYRPISRLTRCALIAPLLVEERIEGLLVVERQGDDPFDEHQLDVLTTLAQQTAAALESTHQHRRATIDSLTGFFLRDYYFNRLAEEQRRSKRYGGHFALLMVDLDNFKSINDNHGHLVGDRYLRAVAATVRAQLRAADLPCRYGGDEFSLLLPETDLAGASTIAERIRAAVASLRVEIDGGAIRGTVSIGFATFPEQSTEETNGLLQLADEALYRAKRAGRDRVVSYAA